MVDRIDYERLLLYCSGLRATKHQAGRPICTIQCSCAGDGRRMLSRQARVCGSHPALFRLFQYIDQRVCPKLGDLFGTLLH